MIFLGLLLQTLICGAPLDAPALLGSLGATGASECALSNAELPESRFSGGPADEAEPFAERPLLRSMLSKRLQPERNQAYRSLLTDEQVRAIIARGRSVATAFGYKFAQDSGS